MVTFSLFTRSKSCTQIINIWNRMRLSNHPEAISQLHKKIMLFVIEIKLFFFFNLRVWSMFICSGIISHLRTCKFEPIYLRQRNQLKMLLCNKHLLILPANYNFPIFLEPFPLAWFQCINSRFMYAFDDALRHSRMPMYFIS